jgi:hypothetical protein
MYRRKDVLIACRNKQVSTAIDENYRKDTGDDAGAATYCVSNRMYMRHLRGYDKTDEKKAPTMTSNPGFLLTHLRLAFERKDGGLGPLRES